MVGGEDLERPLSHVRNDDELMLRGLLPVRLALRESRQRAEGEYESGYRQGLVDLVAWHYGDDVAREVMAVEGGGE